VHITLTTHNVLLILAVVVAVLAAFSVAPRRISLLPLALALFAAAFLFVT
jgi:hypothetical protein